MLPFRLLPLVALVALLAFPTAAAAVDYPPAGKGGDEVRTGKAKTFTVSDPSTFEKFWIRHPHSAQKGIRPLERFGAARANASATKRVKVADNFYSPKKFSVAKGTTIKWVWSNRNADSHDVYLNKKPKGVKHFQSAPAATFFSFKRKLRKAGTYKFLCTFHEGMTMRINVKS